MDYVFVIVIFIILVGGFASMIYLINKSNNFFDKADKVEIMILEGQSEDLVVKSIYELHKDSFIRKTGDRVNELAKMAEVKYGVVLLK